MGELHFNVSQIFYLFFRGTFRMERDDGYSFDCRIPPFSLESKGDDPNDPAIVGNWKLAFWEKWKCDELVSFVSQQGLQDSSLNKTLSSS